MFSKIGSKKRTKSKMLILVFIFFIFINSCSSVVTAANSPPKLTHGTVTPRRGYPNIDYLFTVTYEDADNDAPAGVRVVIDQVDYLMEEVDPTDVNYSDGKEYSFKKALREGTYSVYYTADDGNGGVVTTSSFTLSVTWDVGHYDIIHFIEEKVFPGVLLLLAIIFILLLILCLISIFMMLQMRKIAKGLEAKEVEKKEHEEGVEELEGEKKEIETS
ncbi:MAG: hypothetical protein JSV56_10920 [Methanomassiliicoccales archaeon]|nr:MAG: hypothetical protein JSV56_10920 [Methanomassiliicoccales archaeon]